MRGFTTVLVSCLVLLSPTLSPAATPDGSSFHPEAWAALIDNRLSEATAAYREFLDTADTGAAADRQILDALSGLGTALVLQEKAEAARVHLERGLRMQTRLAPDEDLLAAELRHALARAALLQGHDERALRLLWLELKQVEPHADERPERVARTIREATRIQTRLGRLDAHRDLIDRELALYEQALDARRIVVPAFLEQVARDATGADRALRLHFLRATALSSEPIWRNERALADALRGLAVAYVAEGDTRESLYWFEKAWLIRAPERFEEGLEAYGAYPNQKAFAMALDAHGRWTFGFFTGERALNDAIESALRECRRRLPWSGIETDCRLYALNEAIVWEPVSSRHRALGKATTGG